MTTHSKAPNCLLKTGFLDIFDMNSNSVEQTDKVNL